MPDESMVMDSVVPEISTDTGAQEAPETNEVVESTVETTGAQERPEVESTDQTADDGRTIPQQWRELFKKDSKLRGVYFSDRAFRQAAPGGPNQVKEIFQKWEQFGGDEGLQQIESERSYWNELDQNFVKGDPAFIESIAKADPEAFAKSVPAALDKLYALDKPAYDHLGARIILNSLDKASPIGEIYQLLAGNDATKAIAQKLAEWYGTIEKLATNQPVKTVDPEREKLNQERQQFETQKQQEFGQSLEKEHATHNLRRLDTVLAKAFAKSGTTLEAMKKQDYEGYWRLIENCNGAVAKLVGADTRFQGQYNSIVTSGDRQRAMKFGQARLNQPDVVEAINKTYNTFYKFFNRSQAKPGQVRTNGNGQATGTVQLASVPNPKDLDWPRMNAHGVKPIDGKAYLKGRKELVTF